MKHLDALKCAVINYNIDIVAANVEIKIYLHKYLYMINTLHGLLKIYLRR